MSSYRRGRYLEYLARDALVARGYTVVRSAGSKGPVDLVATGPQHVLFIQVKAQGRTRPIDIEKLRAVPVPARGVHKEIWERRANGGWHITRLKRRR